MTSPSPQQIREIAAEAMARGNSAEEIAVDAFNTGLAYGVSSMCHACLRAGRNTECTTTRTAMALTVAAAVDTGIFDQFLPKIAAYFREALAELAQ